MWTTCVSRRALLVHSWKFYCISFLAPRDATPRSLPRRSACPHRYWLPGLALLWQIFSGTGFPNQFFNDSWVVGFWRADHGRHNVELGRRASRMAQAVLGSMIARVGCHLFLKQPEFFAVFFLYCGHHLVDGLDVAIKTKQ